jgi:serine/threonine protein kinase/class 3 adenylate cyclase
LQVDLLESLLDAEILERSEDSDALGKDVFDLGQMICFLLEHADFSDVERQSLLELADRATDDNWLLRPTMDQVAEEIHELHDVVTDGESDGGATMQFELGATIPKVSPTRQIGRFLIESRLGNGAMGEVFLGRDPIDQTVVAIKMLAENAAKNPKSAARFVKEARLLGSLHHPAIARLIEFRQAAEGTYLAMEFVSGGTLADAVRQGQTLAEPLALSLMADAARGLSVAHAAGLVHRDIKPANLLLTERGREVLRDGRLLETVSDEPLLKVADFGLAKHVEGTDSIALTGTGALLGTPLYMAPEQCTGETLTAAVDVYALGATLFQCLAGRPPFEGNNPVEIIRQHCTAAVPSLRSLRPEVSDAVQQLIERCLSKSAAARFRDAGALLDELHRLSQGAPTSIALHPPAPSGDAKDLLTFEHVWELRSPPSLLWRHVSNTDRVNHALGLPPVSYRTFQDPELGVRRIASTRVAGMELRWEEHPYEWIEGRRLSVLRQFETGPLIWFSNVVELMPHGGGTRLTQRFQVRPRNRIGRWWAKWELGKKSGKSFGRLYHRLDDYLTGMKSNESVTDPFGSKKSMSPTQFKLLERRFLAALDGQAGIDPRVVESLQQYLRFASDLDVARIRPLALAERLELDGQQVVHACLLLAREGVLILLWDILCPTCQIPSEVQETLKSLQNHGHCEACQTDFQLDFANSIELVFRVHPEIRTVETRTYCIGGPAFHGHVALQVRLAPGERFHSELALSDGEYRLRGPQLPYVMTVRVSPSSRIPSLDLELKLAPTSFVPPPLQSGTQVLTLQNASPRPMQVRLERTASRHDALTAAAAARLPAFREWFPREVLSPGQMVSLTTVTLMGGRFSGVAQAYMSLGDVAASNQLLDAFGEVAKQLEAFGGTILKTMNDQFVAVLPTPLAAIKGATQLFHPPLLSFPLGVVIHQGPVMVATLQERLDYYGRTAQVVAGELSRMTGPGLWLTEACFADGEVAKELAQRGWKVHPEFQVADLTMFKCDTV